MSFSTINRISVSNNHRLTKQQQQRIPIYSYLLLIVSVFLVQQVVSRNTPFGAYNKQQSKTNMDDDDENPFDNKSYYEILNVPKTAPLLDIKKAYRKLALLYHPDRNIDSIDQEKKSNMFRKVAEAYEVLSDTKRRTDYDHYLKYSHGSSNTGSNTNQGYQQQQQYGGSGSAGGGGGGFGGFGSEKFNHPFFNRKYRDPMEQFNDLFNNDKFFNDALFRDMDTIFQETFVKNNMNNNNNNNPNNNRQQQNQKKQNQNQKNNQNQKQASKNENKWDLSLGSIGLKLLKACGVDFQISTSYNDGSGTSYTSQSYSSSSHRIHNNNINGQSRTSTSTAKSTKTIIQNGQRITIQSMEQDGNKIEEKYINNELVERKINGQHTSLLTTGSTGTGTGTGNRISDKNTKQRMKNEL